jgi:hypothetical protein
MAAVRLMSGRIARVRNGNSGLQVAVAELPFRTDVLVSVKSAGRILVGSYLDFSAKLRGVSEGEAMSDRRRFLKGLTSLPLATVLANPLLAAAVSAGLQEIEAKLADGGTVNAALAVPQGQAMGSILLVHE